MEFTYYMSKTESEQWHSNAKVNHRGNEGSRYPTTREYCRDLIEDIASERGSQRIVDDKGVTVI